MFKKPLVFIVTLLFVMSICLTAVAQTPVKIQKDKKFYIVLQGAYGMVSEIGSVDEYIAGENDFPVTPSFSEMGGGLGFYFNLSKTLGLSLSAEYLMGADVEKVDPSDGETYSYTTYDNVNVIASLMLKFGGKTQFFISGGGGFNILMPYDNKEETGSLGSIIVIEAPDSTTNLLIAAGGGVLFNTGKILIKLEAQYIMVMDYDKNSIFFKVGIGF